MKNITRTIKRVDVKVKYYDVITDEVCEDIIALFGTEVDYNEREEIVKDTEEEFKKLNPNGDKVMIKMISYDSITRKMVMSIDNFYRFGNFA